MAPRWPQRNTSTWRLPGSGHSDLHRLVAGSKRLIPNTVDLCLSIAGDGAVTPVLIIKDAGGKNLEVIADEVRARASEEQLANQRLQDKLRKWGWLLPALFLRRFLMRSLLNQLWYRRSVSGTFQLTFLPAVDLFVPFLFNTAAALSAGAVRDRVVAVNGKIELRPMLTLACCFDHKSGMDWMLQGLSMELSKSLNNRPR
jgi:pyruvate/2-oxoglutarate dehydrogenase complex dihydrolipoamide acyltransferase (E2) component